LSDFKEGRATALVATDIAARGIDIEQLPFVINYELPYTPEDYVHRIGRTGRAGMPGEAISLVCEDEHRLLVDIEKLLKRSIPRKPGDEFMPARGERGQRRESQRHAPPAPSPIPPVSAHSAKSDDGFDFSKPYEPSSATKAPAASAKPPSIRGRTPRPTAALLGGLPPPAKSAK